MKTLAETTTNALHSLTRDLLLWLSRTPRTYAETMDAWRSSCPRLTIWEDALADGLVTVVGGKGTTLGQPIVVPTEHGRKAIENG